MKSFLAPLIACLTMATTVLAAWPINDICPVDGKAARPIYRVKSADGFVAFCCMDCLTSYEKSPGKYPVTKKEQQK
ncbi:MAG: hypothetical protein ACK5TH_24105 [Prosthecobacter sp.]